MPIASHKAAAKQIEALKNPNHSQNNQSYTNGYFQSSRSPPTFAVSLSRLVARNCGLYLVTVARSHRGY
jgi:hypothetical protein